MEPYQPLSRSIAGKVAIVTGAASGMGRATAHLFASEGAHVAVTDLDQGKCDAVVQEIEAAGYSGSAKAWALDVSDQAAIKSVVAEIAEAFGGIDILVNNAGFAIPADVAEESYEDSWGPTLEVMLAAHQRMIRAALSHLRNAEYPRIVNVASTEGLGATPGNSPLCRGEAWRDRPDSGVSLLTWAVKASPSIASVPARSARALPMRFPKSIRPSTPSAAYRCAVMLFPKRWRI